MESEEKKPRRRVLRLDQKKASPKEGEVRRNKLSAKEKVEEVRRRGIYLFPNLVTTTSLLLGFYAITESFRGAFLRACWAIFFAAIFDGLDGKVARLTKTDSDFGAQYDSLSDLVSFGVAPGIIMYNFALAQSFRPRIGWTVAFIYVVCGALRLARYNIRPTSKKRFFEGLPIPGAAYALVFSVIFAHHVGLVTKDGLLSSTPNLMLFLTLAVGLLMISTLPYYGFKDVDLFRRHKFGTLVLFVIVLVVVFQEPESILFLALTAYVLSGPVVWYFRRKRGSEPETGAPT